MYESELVHIPNVFCIPFYRILAVKTHNVVSSSDPIQNGVLQGEVFSVCLFLIAINDLTKCIKFPLTQRLFADDYNISLRSSNPHRAHRLLQQALNHRFLHSTYLDTQLAAFRDRVLLSPLTGMTSRLSANTRVILNQNFDL